MGIEPNWGSVVNMRIWAKAKKVLNRFAKADCGNISILMGIAVIPMVLAGGAAVDYERAINSKQQLVSSLDSAAIYAANLSNATDAAMTTASKPFLDQNFATNHDATVTTFSVTSSGTAVIAKATLQMNNWFMAIVGQPTTSIVGSSTVQKSGLNLEISLVLDNTGSMNSTNAQTGNAAIDDLKTSAAKFVDMVMPATQGTFYTKIAAIPYNNSVNLGTSALATAVRGSILSGTGYGAPGHQNYNFTSYTGNNLTYSSSTCATERQGANADTDAAFATSPAGYFYGPAGYNDCTVTTLQPLTTDKTSLLNTINAMSAGNSTAGQVGIAWGWYTLSPTVGIWSGVSAPAGYDKLTTSDPATKVRKIMILMTDAEYNSAFCNGIISAPSSLSGSGSQSYQASCSSPLGNSYTQSAAMCAGIKQSGVEIYVITFQLNKSYANRVSLVSSCATDASHIIDADTTSLDGAFQSMANQVLAMRIAQ